MITDFDSRRGIIEHSGSLLMIVLRRRERQLNKSARESERREFIGKVKGSTDLMYVNLL